MPAKPLTTEQLQDANRLKLLFNRRKEEDSSFTQEKLAFVCGWKTQGAINQYLNGKIPLNLRALQKFSDALNVTLYEISPSLASEVATLQKNNIGQRVVAIPVQEESLDDVEIRLYKPYELEDDPIPSGSDIESSVKKMTISLSYLKSKGVKFSSVENLALTSAIGDSMEATYSDGDLLLIDRGIHHIKDNGIYGLTLTDEIYTRRLERRPNGDIHIISDNSIYEPYIVTPDSQGRLKIRYRVVFAWTGKKFS